MDVLDIKIEFNNIPLKFPKGQDKWPMMESVTARYDSNELRHLNQVRIYQQVLFLSNVLCANGKQFDACYKKSRPVSEKWSSLCFPQENLPKNDFKLWEEALYRVAPGGRVAGRQQLC